MRQLDTWGVVPERSATKAPATAPLADHFLPQLIAGRAAIARESGGGSLCRGAGVHGPRSW